jgi:DNA-binding IclR family transcriptional regulator
MKDKQVPALGSGLTLVELVASAGPLGSSFTVLLAVGFPKASLARQLATLVARGWLVKSSSGTYLLGPVALGLAQRGDPTERLRAAAAPLLAELRDRSGNSALAVAWSGGAYLGVAKAVAEDGVTMQELGTVSLDLAARPWGWIAAELTGLPSVWPDEATRRHFLSHGVAWDNGRSGPHGCRLAAPVLVDGRLLGCLALGGTVQSMPESRLAGLSACLVQTATAVAARLSVSAS